MTVQEMHIGVNQWLQKINSKNTSSFEPPEIDWALSEECLRFIKQRMSPVSNTKRQGFQSTQKRYDDLEELLTTSKLSCYYKDSDTVSAFLPQNYFRLVSDRSYTKDLCGAPISSISTVSEQKQLCVVPFPEATETNSPFYQNLQIVRQDNTQILFDVNDYPTTANGLGSKAEKFYIINLMLEKMNLVLPVYDKNGDQNITSIEVRWENYDGTYYPNSFIFVVTGIAGFTGITINPQGLNYSASTIQFLKYNPSPVNRWPNRLVKTEDLYTTLPSDFIKTTAQSPVSTIARGKLNVHHDKKFILSFVIIDYIRKPRKIDLTLNQSCELNPNVHEELVENTARRLAGITKGDNYQQLINENLLTE